MNAQTPVVVTDELTKTYGERTAVDAVSMTVRRGEVYGFLGPNGAGKTTTLRMLLGLVRPTSGSATLLTGTGDAPRVGALIEGPGFHPYLSGRDNLRALARFRGFDDAEADRVLARVDLADRGDDRYKGYSLGMKQRLGVAAALMGDPELVILDEPTNGLDPGGMMDMRALIVDLAASGHTVLLSSHLLGEVQEICDRVGVIDHGRLLHESTVASLRGGSTLHVRATPASDALAIARNIAGEDSVRPTADGLVADLGTDVAPRLARELVAGGVDIFEIAAVERSLEDAFFEMTTNRSTATKEYTS